MFGGALVGDMVGINAVLLKLQYLQVVREIAVKTFTILVNKQKQINQWLPSIIISKKLHQVLYFLPYRRGLAFFNYRKFLYCWQRTSDLTVKGIVKLTVSITDTLAILGTKLNSPAFES